MTMLLDDKALGAMGIVKVTTLLPPTPLMLMAGTRALLSSQVCNARPNALIEAIFVAMATEGLMELGRLEEALLKSTAAAVAHGIDGSGATAEVLPQTRQPHPHAGCTACRGGARAICDCSLAGHVGTLIAGSAGIVSVAVVVGEGTGAAGTQLTGAGSAAYCGSGGVGGGGYGGSGGGGGCYG